MEEQVQAYAKARGFHPQTLARLSRWEPAASAALGRLTMALKISENHLRDLMDWLEEIALRDNRDIDAVLAEKALVDIETDPRLGRADKLKRFKEEVRRRRFPRLARAEERLKNCVTALKLQPDISLSVPPGLEGGRLRVEFTASSQQEMRKLAAKLAEAAENEAIREAFALLSGVAADTR